MKFLGVFKKEKRSPVGNEPKLGLLHPRPEEPPASPEKLLPALAARFRQQMGRWGSWWRYEPEVFFGFDLVADQLRWVRLAKKPKAGVRFGWVWELSNFGIRDLAPTPDFDEEDKERTLVEFLEQLVPPGRYQRAKFYLSLYGAGALFRRFTIPKLKNKNEEKEAVIWEARKQVPFPLENSYWTYRLIARETGNPNKTEIVFVAILRTVLDRLVALFMQAGVPLSGIGLGAFGFADVLPEPPREEKDAVGLLEITPKSSYFSIYGKNGLEFFREFSSLGLKPADLEEGGLGRFLGPLTSEALSSLDFYQAQYAGRKLVHLFLAGLPGGDLAIPAHFEAAIGSKTSILTQARELSYAVENAAEFAELYPFFAKALGVALGRDRSLYLLPDVLASVYRQSDANRLVFRLALPLLAFLGIFQGFYLYKLKSAETLLETRQREITRLEAVPGFAQAAALQQKIEATQSFLSKFVRYPAVFPWYLKELSNLTPPEIALDRVALLPVMNDSASDRQKHGVFDHIELVGSANAHFSEADAVVVEFIRRLEHSPFFGPVKIMSKSEEKYADRKTVGFSFEVALR